MAPVTATITSVGQITIPRTIRQNYQLSGAVKIVPKKDGILIQKVESLDERLDKVRAKFSEETKAWIRENAGKTASELRKEILDSDEWAEYTEEKYGI